TEARGWKFDFPSLPSHTVTATSEDTSLCKGKVPSSVTLPEKFLVDSEELARRSLAEVAVLERFTTGLAASLRHPSDDPQDFRVKEDLDPEAVRSFLFVLSRTSDSLFSLLSVLYGNSILARRQMVLAASDLDDATRKSLRALPIEAGSLFSNRVATTVKTSADRRRDALILSSD
ncbi:hypothetical protein BaRGS_00016643, partial [Batillaria attramentaria]